MNHAQFAEHTEHYTVNGVTYAVTANFVSELIIIKGSDYYNKIAMGEYTDFDGNMEEFLICYLENTKCT